MSNQESQQTRQQRLGSLYGLKITKLGTHVKIRLLTCENNKWKFEFVPSVPRRRKILLLLF